MRAGCTETTRPGGWVLALIAFAVLAAVLVAGAAPADAGTSRGKVVRVADGDSFRAKVGRRTRTYHLRGVDAPELRGSAADTCYGRQARRALGRYLRRRSPVKLRTRGRSRHAQVLRGRRDVNRAMVRAGHARAKRGGGSYGRRLRRDERVAKQRNRGLWAACAQGPGTGGDGDAAPAPAPPGGAQPGDVTGQQAVDQLSAELRDAAFRTVKNSGDGLSDDFELHLCGDGRFRYKQNTTFVSGEFTSVTITERFGSPWRVTEALIRGDGSYRGARVAGTFTQKRTRQDGGDVTEPIDEPAEAVLENGNGQWYWNGQAAQHFPGQAGCDPAP